MSRAKQLFGMGAACMLAIGAVLVGSVQNDSIVTAGLRAAGAESSAAYDQPSVTRGEPSVTLDVVDDEPRVTYDKPSAAQEQLPVVVITGHRESKPLVLSERNTSSRSD